MSYVIALPQAFAAAAAELTAVGEAIEAAAAVAALSTTGIVAAASDEVSAAIAGFLGNHAEEFQALSARLTLLEAQFVRALSDAGAGYAAAEAANGLSLRMLLPQAESLGLVSSLDRLLGRPLFGSGPAAADQPDTVLNTGTHGVTGVKTGFSFLRIPVGPGSFFGIPFGFEYPAPARWYFPTQSDGSVNADGVVYLQHGFGAIGWFYQPLAMELAQQTNSVVVVPTIPSIPLPFGLWLNSPEMQQGVGSLFAGSQTALNISANQAGYLGALPEDFILTGHSAGGGLATAAGGYYVEALGANTADNNLLGVVMFDGVSSNSAGFAASIASLKTLDIPVYTVAAPPQPWNAFGATTNQLVGLYPGQFVGVEIVNGSHVDSMLGGKPLIDFFAQLLTGFSPPGATAAVYTLSAGWINDMYAGASPTAPIYGSYGPTGGYLPPGGQQIILGPTAGIVLPV